MIAREPTPVMRDAVIGRGTAAAMSSIFAAVILVPALHQLRSDIRQGGRWSVLSLFRRIPTRESLKEFEEALARDSELGTCARRGYQTALTRILGQGNDRVLVGRDGFLFFRKEVDMVGGEGFLSRRPDTARRGSDRRGERTSVGPVAAIVDTGRQLRARGIPLLFIPIPAKPFVYPERVWPGYPAEAGPAWNRDRGRFLSALSGSGVDVLDVTDDLWRAKAEGEVFLRLDTHWSPLGLRVAADRIAGRLRTIAGVSGLAGPSRTVPVTNGGDLLRMLDLLPEHSPFALQTIEIVRPLEELPGRRLGAIGVALKKLVVVCSEWSDAADARAQLVGEDLAWRGERRRIRARNTAAGVDLNQLTLRIRRHARTRRPSAGRLISGDLAKVDRRAGRGRRKGDLLDGIGVEA